MRRRHLLVLAGLSAAIGDRAGAEILEYKSNAEYAGAVAVVPWIAMGALSRLAAFCKRSYPDLSPRFEAKFSRWRDRHAGYLALSKHFHGVLTGIVKDPATAETARSGLKTMLEVTALRAISQTAETYITSVTSVKAIGRDRDMMSELTDALAAGRMDLIHRHPDLVAFMDKLLAEK